MTTPFSGPMFITDATGAPVPLALIYTYEAGTSTPKAAYTTAACDVPETNPIVAGANGRAMFFLGAGAYRIKVTYPIADGGAELTAYAMDNVRRDIDVGAYVASRESQTATAGQTTITLTTITVVPGVNSCFVAIDGALLPDGEYSVDSTTSISLTEALLAGQTIDVISGRLVTSGVDSTEVSHTASSGVAIALSKMFDERGGLPSIFTMLSEAQRTDVQAYTFSLDLHATLAAAFLLCKRWYFPPGGYKITDELAINTGMRLVGASNADRFYGDQPTVGTPTRFWQATSSKSVFTVGVGVSDFVISDMCMSPVQTPAPYTAYSSGKYGIKMSGRAYDASTQPEGRSSYRGTLRRLTFYQFERGISCVDSVREAAGTPAGADWQCDSIDVEQCHSFSNLHLAYLNTTNADAWSFRSCTGNVWTNGTGVYLQRSGYVEGRSCYFVPAETSAGVAATGATGWQFGEFYDNATLVNCSGSDSLAYFLDVDTSTGYENVYNQITLMGCTVEAPIRVRRMAKVVSYASRFTEDATCSGDDVEVHSIADSWLPTTKSWVMSGLRPRLFVHGGSTQTTGTTAAVVTATATTVFTLPASQGVYEAQVWIAAAGSLYQSFCTLMCDGTTLARIGGTNGANMTITVSGRNVQATQTSGVNQTVAWSYQRVS